MSRSSLFLFMIMVFAIGGCSSEHPPTGGAVETSEVRPIEPGTPLAETGFDPFYVYRDKNFKNRFTPSGYMPDGKCVALDDGWQYEPEEGKTAIRVVYDVACSREGRQWAGVYWQNPPDNWGQRKGGYDLTGATRLVFWAKGELGGERVEEFKVGGLGVGQMYQDSDTASIGPVILTKEWRKYTIDLRGKDLSYISGGFAWVTNVNANPHHCTFYLDDIRFE